MSKEVNYRKIYKLRTRQRDSSGFKTVERVFTKSGLKNGSLGTAYTDKAPVDALDGFPDTITKTNRAQVRKTGTI